ncbi:MAG: 4Fe-4S dicluster domain-containing protein [Bacteroidetes bacterium]|nr:4Fe-4S dicluster domain-containing protein [Bacteroidota bacterium]MBU1720459.1 4Fe-4S dicluster domain-containing protein [Bacteroidota bacterium]
MSAKNFGFSIHKDRQIDYDKNYREFYYRVKAVEPSISLCISCGNCTATCSAGNFTSMNLRNVILLAARGEVNNLGDNVSACLLCGKCQLGCPRGVNTRNVVIAIRKELKIRRKP